MNDKTQDSETSRRSLIAAVAAAGAAVPLMAAPAMAAAAEDDAQRCGNEPMTLKIRPRPRFVVGLRFLWRIGRHEAR
jgi:hypothetical protein